MPNVDDNNELKEDNGDHWDMNAKAFADEGVVEAFKAEEGGRIVKENSFFFDTAAAWCLDVRIE